MCPKATACVAVAAVFFLPNSLSAQVTQPASRLDWRRIGPSALDLGLASLASGPVSRVWYSADGSRLYARTQSGRVFVTADFDSWNPSGLAEPVQAAINTDLDLPELRARVIRDPLQPARLYAIGAHAYRSEDAGISWINVTAFENRSILGEALVDMAVSPRTPDEITVAGSTGVWRSLDGGQSWAGLNDKLPNLPANRLFADAAGKLTIESREGRSYQWQASRAVGWRPSTIPVSAREQQTRNEASRSLKRDVTAAAAADTIVYAGTADGALHVSRDRGATWRPHEAPIGGQINRIVTEGLGSFALAITSSLQQGRVLRTVNSGAFWEDITADLPSGKVAGVAVDASAGAAYVATESGLYMAYTDTVALSPPSAWTLLRSGPTADVALSPGGHQIYASFEGEGIVATLAPHRLRHPSVVSAADRAPRAAAPGTLVSVLGAKVERARAGNASAAVLGGDEVSSELQLPYEMPNGTVLLSLEWNGKTMEVEMPVVAAAPAIFTDPDGLPFIQNADSGLVLDTSQPVRAATRLQIFATGLGNVSPPWPTGLPAPQENAPKVLAPIQVFLGGEVLEVTKASLAPGYTGMYIVEVVLPSIVDQGSAEIYIQSGNAQSNRIQLTVVP